MKGSAIHRGSGQPSGLVDAPTVDLSVVMVSYNTRDLMQQALRTVIEASAGLQVEITVVDNASHDGSADMVEAEFPQVRLIRNSANVGFATANNAAFRRGHGRYVLLLVTILLVANAVVGERGLLALLRANQAPARLQQIIDTLRDDNSRLHRYVEALRDEPRFIADLARRELGMIRPGEQLFIVRTTTAPADAIVASPPNTRPESGPR